MQDIWAEETERFQIDEGVGMTVFIQKISE